MLDKSYTCLNVGSKKYKQYMNLLYIIIIIIYGNIT